MQVINFKSKPKQTFFAPEWDYYLFESYLKNVDFKALASFCLEKEEEIINLKPTLINGKPNDGNTGLGLNNTTARFDKYNFLRFKNENITILKKEIIKFHNQVLDYFKQPLLNELYVQCWVNILREGEQIKPHIHGVYPDTYLGGHICVQCENTSTNYINPINQINNPEIFESKNEVGKITLFQNNIPHYTSLNNSKKERITIAFDLKVKNPQQENFLNLIC